MRLLDMIRKYLSPLITWFYQLIAKIDGKTQLKLENFLPWFEEHILLRPVTSNIPNLNNTVQLLESSLGQLKVYSAECRSTLNPSNTHYARLLKLSDQLDLLCNEYQIGKQIIASSQCLYPYNSNIPDSEYLRDLMYKVKGKLKIIDDLTLIRRTDSVNNKAKGGKSSSDAAKKSFELPPDIKNELRIVSNLIDTLEIETLKNSMLLSYFTELKQTVHRPFHQLRVVISELPNIQHLKTVMSAEMETYRQYCDAYNEARSAEPLVQCAILRNEKQEIEKNVESMVSCMRALLVGQYSDAFWNAVNGDGYNSDWSGALTKFARQPIMDSLSSIAISVVQAVENGIEDTFLGNVSQLKSIIPLVKHKCSKQIPIDVLNDVEQFDIDLFTAYCQDWNEYVNKINVAIKSDEFTSSYKTLMAVRVTVQKARAQYDKCVVEHTAAVNKRKEATTQVEALKKKLIEITLTELYEDIGFVQLE